MNARLLWELLERAVADPRGKLTLSERSGDAERDATLAFLADQGWLAEDGGTRVWTVTPSGKFWFSSLGYGDVVQLHRYGGAVFLLHMRSNKRETIIWRKGRFATISVSHSRYGGEHFEIRRENEPVVTDGGSLIEYALAKACAMIDDDVEEPEPKAEDLGGQMRDYVSGR